MWMNQWDIEDAGRYARLMAEEGYSVPNLIEATETLHNLMRWTNDNSDGWHVWPKPSRAANRLMEAIDGVVRVYRGFNWQSELYDISDADLKAALRPIKAFLTRHGVDHAEVLS